MKDQKSISDTIGDQMYNLIETLYPICRSITGDGVRKTLSIIKSIIPITIHEVPTGIEAFDWEVPKEWNIRDAYIKNKTGKRIVDFNELNLHVLNYSIPINKRVPLNELKEHIYTLPDRPDWVPYRTSYYQENWGFCMSHNHYKTLPDDEYEVLIDSTLEPGYLSYGEYLIPGTIEDEILISTHICHPSLCNDNLSGIAVAVNLAKELSNKTLKYSYRFLFIPGTIGSIVWLSRNENNVHKIKHGLVITLLGDESGFSYKKSRRENTDTDRAVNHYFKANNIPLNTIDFYPYGYDERQYCSPGFNLPVGCFSRAPYGEFPEYHTSADNLDFVKPEKLEESLNKLLDILFILDNNSYYLNTNPKCEPQLGKRGLYDRLGGSNESKNLQLAMLWVLNQSDGNNSLLDIATKSDIEFRLIFQAATALIESGLLNKVKQFK